MFNFGEKLGSGAHGDIWELLNYPDKVMKVAWAPLDVPKEFHNLPNNIGQRWTFPNVQATYQYLLQHQFPALAKIFDFRPLHKRTDRQYYSVLLERLQPLTEPEQKVMKSVCMDYNGNIETGKCLYHIDELKGWLEFNAHKVITFYTALGNLPVIHRDFHRRNIMKDAQGNFKLIDFELLDIKVQAVKS